MSNQYNIKNSVALISLALLFVFTGVDRLTFYPELVSAKQAEAKDKDKDKDKDNDMGNGDFVYDQNTWTFSGDCSNISKLRIHYHKDFISSENISGPNILVGGTDGTGCSINIVKVTGGNKCGFSATKGNGKILIDTKTKGNAQNCEMGIKVVVPRNVKILG
jgi:hypothetical protein